MSDLQQNVDFRNCRTSKCWNSRFAELYTSKSPSLQSRTPDHQICRAPYLENSRTQKFQSCTCTPEIQHSRFALQNSRCGEPQISRTPDLRALRNSRFALRNSRFQNPNMWSSPDLGLCKSGVLEFSGWSFANVEFWTS